jgi:hypothetical protein
MSSQTQPPARLASEDVIINAPFSYAGSAQRIWRIRRHAHVTWALVAITLLAILFVLFAWAFVTVWYVFWGLLLVPYRILRRGARKRKAEALRHRELMGAIQGSAAASSAAIVTEMTAAAVSARTGPVTPAPTERVSDDDREAVIEELRHHMLKGRLITEEFEERVAAVHAAKTGADLDAITVDLPLRPAAMLEQSEGAATGYD